MVFSWFVNLFEERLLVPLACSSAVASGKVTIKESNEYMKSRDANLVEAEQ